jgi:class 3 adenylate cyclase/tetratricopeptide (TPR) repeat protein
MNSDDRSNFVPTLVDVNALTESRRERRVVSVLFADLVGFTSLAEGRDSEEVRDLLTRYFDVARTTIARYGGTIEKFIGDAVMAVWGTPSIHEDDAERSVRAALDLIEAVKYLGRAVGADGLDARVGIMTGEAAVMLDASDQGMVAGDLVNSASRLQSIATPGAVFVDKGTFRASSAAVEFEEAGTHELNGKVTPLTVWRARCIVAGQQGYGRTERLEPPFVGRHDELRALKSKVISSGNEGRLQVAFLLGISGIGKSRLVWELFKHVDGLVEKIYWHQGRSRAYGEDTTFVPLAEVVRARLRIADLDGPSEIRSKLLAALDAFLPDEEEREWVEPQLARLLGLEEERVVQGYELFSAVRTFFERVSDKGTTVLVFDDIQWAADGLFEFLDHLIDYSSGHPIVVLAVARPELLDKRAAWISGLDVASSIHLEPLPSEEMTKLLKGMAVGLTDEVVDPIVARTDGIPLYAVEIVKMLLDEARVAETEDGLDWNGKQGVIEAALPLNALVSARLDVLPPEERSVVLDASVLGPIFSLAALAAIRNQVSEQVRRTVRELVRRELIAVDHDDPRADHRTIYGFIGSLIPEVSYQMVAKRDRCALHLSAAAYFESGHQRDPGLASAHYLKALANTTDEATIPIVRKTKEALVAAAHRASHLGSHAQAVARIEKALELTEGIADGEESASLNELAADFALKGFAHETAEKHLLSAHAWHERDDDPSSLARLSAKLGGVQMNLGHKTEGMQRLEAGLGALVGMDSLASEIDGPRLAVTLADSLLAEGMAPQAREWAEKALCAAEKRDQTQVVCSALLTKAHSAQALGRWREAFGLFMGAGAIADEFELTQMRLQIHLALAVLWQFVRPTEAVAEAERAAALADRLGLSEEESLARSMVGWIGLGVEGAHGLQRILDAGGDGSVNAGMMPEVIGDAIQEVLSGHLAEAALQLQRLGHTSDWFVDEWSTEIRLVDDALSGDIEGTRGDVLNDVKPRTAWGLRVLAQSGRVSVWHRDSAGVETAIKAIEHTPWASTPWARCAVKGLYAGLYGIFEDHERSQSTYREAIAEADAIGSALDAALLHADLARCSGLQGKELVEAEAQAEERFVDLGARGLFEKMYPPSFATVPSII